jgi:MEMO1 family protein
MAREMAVAGVFYEKDFDALNRQIEGCFTHSLGPGDFPIKKRSGFVKAIISPHAGYAYSGPCAAWGYKEIAESSPADVYILIGPNHFALSSSISFEDWKTPFGAVKTDKDFARALSNALKLPIDNSSHEKEHSLEVQLPFLQFADKSCMEKIRIVCITLSDDVNIDRLASCFNEFLAKQEKKIAFIVSSDFTHYGRNYGYLPFSLDVEERLNSLDKKAIDLIISKDAKGFMSYVDRTGATICGALPIYLLLNVLKGEKGSLLIYYRSSEISKDSKNSVSYASIMFK